jgi:hypothetical protein
MLMRYWQITYAKNKMVKVYIHYGRPGATIPSIKKLCCKYKARHQMGVFNRRYSIAGIQLWPAKAFWLMLYKVNNDDFITVIS